MNVNGIAQSTNTTYGGVIAENNNIVSGQQGVTNNVAATVDISTSGMQKAQLYKAGEGPLVLSRELMEKMKAAARAERGMASKFNSASPINEPSPVITTTDSGSVISTTAISTSPDGASSIFSSLLKQSQATRYYTQHSMEAMESIYYIPAGKNFQSDDAGNFYLADPITGKRELIDAKPGTIFLHQYSEMGDYGYDTSLFQSYYSIKLTEAGIFESEQEAAAILDAMRKVFGLHTEYADALSTMEERVVLREAVLGMAEEMAKHLSEKDAAFFMKHMTIGAKSAELEEQGYIKYGRGLGFQGNAQDIGDKDFIYIRPSDALSSRNSTDMFLNEIMNKEDKDLLTKLKKGGNLTDKDKEYLISLFNQFTRPTLNSAFADSYTAIFESLVKNDKRDTADIERLVSEMENALLVKYDIALHQKAYMTGGWSPNNPYVKMAGIFDTNAQTMAERQASAKEKYQTDILSLINEWTKRGNKNDN